MQPTEPELPKVEAKSYDVDLSRVEPSQEPGKCVHNLKEDRSDETEHYIAVVCVKCGWGFLERKALT